ncbi:hypothetical protein GGI18_004412, partial [Coemansia linderi]
MFTFRAGEQKPLLSRDASAPDIERYSQPWDTTQTPTEEACSTKADDDDHDAGGPSAVGSHFHHHYHCHHHHYHVGTKHGARRRYPVPPDDPPQSLDTAALHLAPELDPLTWHSSNQSVSAGTQGNAWLAEILGAHGVGQEWGAEDVARRWSQRRNTLDSAVEEDEFSRYNPHWDDMITFRQTRVRVPRERAWSGSEASFASEAPLDRG